MKFRIYFSVPKGKKYLKKSEDEIYKLIASSGGYSIFKGTVKYRQYYLVKYENKRFRILASIIFVGPKTARVYFEKLLSNAFRDIDENTPETTVIQIVKEIVDQLNKAKIGAGYQVVVTPLGIVVLGGAIVGGALLLKKILT